LTYLKIVIIIFIFAGIAIYEARELVKEKLYRELWAFSILLLIAFVLTVTYILGFRIKLPPLPV